MTITLNDLTTEAGKLLYSNQDEKKLIEVRELNNFRWMHFGDNAVQSVIDLDNPGQPVQPYIISMLSALIFVLEPKTIANIGFGGGTIERFFWTTTSDIKITSIESNKTVILLARKFFAIPYSYKVIKEKALEFISQNNQHFDLIYCDIVGLGVQPKCLTDQQFYMYVFRSLNQNGVFVLNLLSVTEVQLLSILIAVRIIFPWIALLDFSDHRNILLFCFSSETAPNISEYKDRVCLVKEKYTLDTVNSLSRLRLLPSCTINE